METAQSPTREEENLWEVCKNKFEIGREKFNAGKLQESRLEFNAALDAFNRLHTGPGKSNKIFLLKILDFRAATFEAENTPEGLDKSLSDARSMIHLDKTNVRGYLRAARVMQLKGQYETAVGVCKNGMKYVLDSKGVEMLKAMRDKAQERLNAKIEAKEREKGRDFMVLFPLERCQRVAKHWHNFISSSPKLFRHLDFLYTPRKLTDYAMKRIINRSRSSFTKLTLGPHINLTDETFEHVARACKALTHLKIVTYWGPVSTAKYSLHKFVVDGLGIAARTTLRILELDLAIDIRDISGLLTECVALEALECHEVRFWGGSVEPPEVVFPCHKKLKRFLLDMCQSTFRIALPIVSLPVFLMRHARSFPNLEELVIGRIQPSENEGRLDFSDMKKLRRLSLTHLKGEFIYPRLPESIIYLDLSNNPGISVEPALIEESPLPLLENLDFSDNHRLSIPMLKALLKPGLAVPTPLKSLDVSNCPLIDFDNLSEWLTTPGRGDQLEEICFDGNPTFTDFVTTKLDSLTKLERLSIAATKISGIGLLNLVNRTRIVLGWIQINGCTGVGADAIELGRQKGVKILWAGNSDSNGGRLVRYGSDRHRDGWR
ncbi:hypothetical protein RUND412_002183 [Rhizina undulata]